MLCIYWNNAYHQGDEVAVLPHVRHQRRLLQQLRPGLGHVDLLRVRAH